MVEFMMSGGIVETVLDGMRTWTGSDFLSILLIVILLIALFIAFGLNLEWTAVAILPLLILLMTWDRTFYSAGGVLLIFIGINIAKAFFRV